MALTGLQLVIGTLITDYEWTAVADDGHHTDFPVTLKAIGTKPKATKVI